MKTTSAAKKDNQVAVLRGRAPAAFEAATVVAARGEGAGAALRVEVDGRALEARRAASCLLEPGDGDRVLVAPTTDGWFVLAVLTRGGAGAAELRVDGDLTVHPRGKLDVTAPGGIVAATPRDASLLAAELNVTADRATFLLEEATLLGAKLKAHVNKLTWIGETVESSLTRLYTRATRSYRVIEETDTVRAGHVDVTARECVRFHADATVITSDTVTKIDGPQVHIG
jgi:hypothetical protein